MKALGLILVLTFLSCTPTSTVEEEEISNIPEELIGKWKVIEQFDSHGGSLPYWISYETPTSYDYWFKENGEYLRNDGTLQGSFKIHENNDIDITSSSTQNTMTNHIEYLSQDTLIIGALFIHPVKWKYYKISSERK